MSIVPMFLSKESFPIHSMLSPNLNMLCGSDVFTISLTMESIEKNGSPALMKDSIVHWAAVPTAAMLFSLD